MRSKFNPGKLLTIWLNKTEFIRMRWCPPGFFYMGATDKDPQASFYEKPQQYVNISSGFWIAETPFTLGQHNSILQRQGEIDDSQTHQPMNNVTWYEAIEMIELINQNRTYLDTDSPNVQVNNAIFSLPSEAQWEYACRAGTKSIRYFSDSEKKLRNYAWYQANKGSNLPSVGLKKPNPWNLYDMYGLVDEWCMDDYEVYPRHGPTAEAIVDPLVIAQHSKDESFQKVIRGGYIGSRSDRCRSSARHGIFWFNEMNDYVGFRIVMTLKE